MTTPQDWLARLADATDYRQLQDVFAAMAADARGTDDPGRLVASIDEAIERLRRERARDEDELRAMEGEYEKFKEKQGGVFGWVKRHTPFTETRRRDKEHQEQVEAQEAEILADNLVIARAQLLKESLLPGPERRIGADRDDWRRRLAASDDVTRVRAYAEAIAALQGENRGGRAFLAEVTSDVDAFARAEFADDADKRRKKTDLAAARSELDALDQELRRKEALVEEAGKRLRELITEELAVHDPSFGVLRREVADLAEATAKGQEAKEGLAKLTEALARLREAGTAWRAVEAKRAGWMSEAGSLEQTVGVADRKRAHAEIVATEYARQLEEAERALAEAREAGGAQTAPSPDVLRRIEEAEAAHRVAAATHESAARSAREAHDAFHALSKRLVDGRRTAEDIEREWKAAAERVEEADGLFRHGIRDVEDGAEVLRDAFARLGRSALPARLTSALPRLAHDVGATDLRRGDLKEDVERELADLVETAEREHASLAADLADGERRREAAWARRSEELLGSALAADVL